MLFSLLHLKLAQQLFGCHSTLKFFLGLHQVVIFTIRPDTGFAGYQKKNLAGLSNWIPDILLNISEYEYNSNISHKIIRHHLFQKIR